MDKKEIKIKKNTYKITDGTNPLNTELHEFLLNGAIIAPACLPLEQKDVDPSSAVL